MKSAKTDPKRRREKRPRTCPQCGSTDVVPILYGYPAPEAREEADRGEIALGGCVITGDDPQRHCNACGNDFNHPRPRAGSPLR